MERLAEMLAREEIESLRDRVARLAAERYAVRRQAEDATEYVLAQINHDLRARVKKLEAALREMVYETTHLSREEDDGSHRCTISKEALEQARAALANRD